MDKNVVLKCIAAIVCAALIAYGIASTGRYTYKQYYVVDKWKGEAKFIEFLNEGPKGPESNEQEDVKEDY